MTALTNKHINNLSATTSDFLRIYINISIILSVSSADVTIFVDKFCLHFPNSKSNYSQRTYTDIRRMN